MRQKRAGITLSVLILLTICCSGKKWTDVESLSLKDRTVNPGSQFRIIPAKTGKSLIKNTGVFFEVAFTATRLDLDNENEVIFQTTSHFSDIESGKSGFVFDQTTTPMEKNTWPSGVKEQEIKINCPFFPWELKSDRKGSVYFYLIDAEDGTCLSNIVMIPVHIKVK